MQQLLRCSDGERIRKTDLVDEFEVEPKTIQRDMQFFLHHHLIHPNVHKGYAPEPRLFQIVDRLERLDPVKYDFEKPWREIYPL
jgi:DeoR/GlpR family transcriptional regulator of sugar metabolism